MSNLFTRQKRGVGLAYPLPGADALLAIDAVNDDIQLDTARMAATAVISTECFDRDGDIVEQAGLDFENYSKNPVVFFNHQAWPLPIGKSEDEDGRLTVQKHDRYTTATCYFSQNSRQAEQIYHLVADKTLRGTSIGFLVKRAVPIQGTETLGMARLTNRGRDAGYRIQAAEVTEWSWVGIGANPDAVLVHLQKGLIAGRAIDERLKLALEPYAARMHGGLVAVPAEVEQIEKRGKYDPNKHPRGGNSDNPGQFSSSSGSHAKPKKKPAKDRSESNKPPKASGDSKEPSKPERGPGEREHGEAGVRTPSNGSGDADHQGTESGKPGSHEAGSGKPEKQRYLAGLSIEEEEPPKMADVLHVQATIQHAFDSDKSIIESHIAPTVGLYEGTPEKSFFTQWTAKRDAHDPESIISTMAEIASKHNQKDIFVSKILEDYEESDNVRPGAEVRFRSKLTADEAAKIGEEFRKHDIDGFTLIPDPNRKEGEDAFVGMRVQVVPELSMRFNDEFRESMKKHDNIKKYIDEKTDKIMGVIADLYKNNDNVASTKFMRFDTLVIGKENYDEYIGRRTSPADRITGGRAWFGQPIGSLLEKAARRLSPEGKKRYAPKIGGRHLLRRHSSHAFPKAKQKKEKILERANGRRTHCASIGKRRSSNGIPPNERFFSHRDSNFRAPALRFLKAISSVPIRPARVEVSPAWVFLKNLSRLEVAPLIPVPGRPRSHRHYCIKCKKCQRRIFACRCAAQNKPVKWSTCDPCLGARMVTKSLAGTTRAGINLTLLVGQPKTDQALHLALKRIHKHHAEYDLTRSQALSLSIAAHAIQDAVSQSYLKRRWHRLNAAKKLNVIDRVVNSRPEASSKQAYTRVFTRIIQS